MEEANRGIGDGEQGALRAEGIRQRQPRDQDEDRRQPFWDVLENPEGFANKNHSARFCLDTIDRVREETREFLATLDDACLEKTYSHTRGETTMETTLRWILHHLVDHEAQHKGQILMLKRLLGLKNESWI